MVSEQTLKLVHPLTVRRPFRRREARGAQRLEVAKQPAVLLHEPTSLLAEIRECFFASQRCEPEEGAGYDCSETSG